jgi:hypothetical protein
VNEELHNEDPTYDSLNYLFSHLLGSGVRSEEGPPYTYHWEFAPTPGTITAPGWAELAEIGRLNEELRKLAQSIAWFGSMDFRQPPALHRRLRYAAQERRRRNEARRQMAAYQRRQQARGQA